LAARLSKFKTVVGYGFWEFSQRFTMGVLPGCTVSQWEPQPIEFEANDVSFSLRNTG